MKNCKVPTKKWKRATEFNGWLVGHVWQLADDGSSNDPHLESSGIWHLKQRRPPSAGTGRETFGSVPDYATGTNETATNEHDSFNIDIEKFDEFRRITARTQFSKGEGLIGRVMQSGQPEWVTDIREQPDTFRRSIHGLGLHAAIAFPITIDADVVAVMEFFSDQTTEPQPRFLEIVPDIGSFN